MSTLKCVLGHPTLRLIAAALPLLGAHNASAYPNQSLIAIEKIGLSKGTFSLVLVVAVTSSVLFGILGNQYRRGRPIALITARYTTAGLALMILMPGKVSVILTQGPLPRLSSSIHGQLFALLLIANPAERRERAAIQANIRSAMAISFLLMLIFWTAVSGTGVDVTPVCLSAGAASLGMAVLVYFRWPRGGTPELSVSRSGLNLGAARREMADRRDWLSPAAPLRLSA